MAEAQAEPFLILVSSDTKWRYNAPPPLGPNMVYMLSITSNPVIL